MSRVSEPNYIYLGKYEPYKHCSYEMIGPKDLKNNDLTQVGWCMKDGPCLRNLRPVKTILYRDFYK